jgi:signal transduction histidine kinase
MADELLVSNELKAPVEAIDVHEVIAGAGDVIQAIVGPGVRVETFLVNSESRVYARQVDLDRILLNVVCNAAAAMQSGGVLMIETAHLLPSPDDAKGYPDAPFGKLRLTLADSGCGVPVRDVWQVRDSTQPPRLDGGGIGLSSVSLILMRLGGALEIAGRDGVGSVVEITLPLAHPSRERVH